MNSADVTVVTHWQVIAAAVAVTAFGCGRPIRSGVIPIAEASLLASRVDTGVAAKIRGVVTFFEQQSGNSILQDSSGGIRVRLGRNTPALEFGDEVEASGLIRVNGPFALMIEPSMVRVRHSVMPPAKQVLIDRDDLANLTYQRISFRGTIQSSVDERIGLQKLIVRSGSATAIVHARARYGIDHSKFEGGEVNVEGVLVRLDAVAHGSRELQIWCADVNSLRLLKEPRSGEPMPVQSVSNVQLSPPPGEIRTIRAVHALKVGDAALSLPVHLNAVVTFYSFAQGLLFVQDETDAIFVAPGTTQELPLHAGDRVEITGVTKPGDFAPNVGQASVRLTGAGALPLPQADAEMIFSAQMDCRWVELEGVVQQVEPENGGTRIDLLWGSHAFTAHLLAPAADVYPLLHRRVVLRGATGTVFNNRRQVLGIKLFVPGLRFVRMTDPAQPALPFKPIETLLQYSPGSVPGQPQRVRGVVTLSSPAGPTWIQDESGGLLIAAHAKLELRDGDVVDVIGSPRPDGFGPMMSSATIARIRSDPHLSPRRISPEDALEGSPDKQLVEIEGVVVNAWVERTDRVATLRSGPSLFVVRVPPRRGGMDLAADLLPGTLVRVTGICSVMIDRHQEWVVPTGFEILARSADDLMIVRSASWFSLAHVAAILLGALVLVLACSGWIVMLRRNVRSQTSRLIDKTEELEQANETVNRALQAAREAEKLEQDRKVVLEMIARDDSLEHIVSVIADMICPRLPGAFCSVQIELSAAGRICKSSVTPTLTVCDLTRLRWSHGAGRHIELSPAVELASRVDFAEQERLNHFGYLAVPIRTSSTLAGAVIAIWPRNAETGAEQVSILESWARLAGLAVERRDLYEQLSHRARFDDLTGLHNRVSLYDYLAGRLSAEEPEHRLAAVIYIDLDDFKQINDTLGHDAGDCVLREMAQRIRRQLRGTDFAARVGGDEFVVVLGGVHSRREADSLGDCLVATLREPIIIGGREMRPGASHGIGIFPDDGMDLESLLKAADDRMYRTKFRRKGSGAAPDSTELESSALMAL